ncbi:guanylate kinase [Allofrancisella guangzhouensis]|uniref:Guanylate kinase n=1 Tax=Allofrancisella guangzhouensis TaxID=594679 RepID=A0A0A8E429_9GAMM|nr:guanylate kinase [Allofrancisella guangzhouensis]AJC48970.1 guanylate kinase [Allofrancisella guangzhouensis]MBK2027875.1 guanylate kinase [Allofrancisella guangzhouensis]MBK2044182.1 guanylate kinase [Allofrancisella guangzhouensis]MBK2045108.1 guanylate kinase [Allofrancisella guangzhouensis]
MRNYIFIVSAPSGAGKSSLLKAFLGTQIGKSSFSVAVSHTTRLPRVGETNGKEYYFVDTLEFENIIKKDGFLEYARVFKNYYGTSKAELDRLLKAGKNIILEIDWQGAQQTRIIYKDKVKSLFILPPSLNELRNRLEARNTDTKETIDYRMKQAESEIAHANEYDYQLVNDDFDKALVDLCKYFKENTKS